jgi:Animal haem peroxidase
MPYSAVPRITLNDDDTISLVVNVDGFKAGTPIELSGQATQTNGAVATFYSVQEMPAYGTKSAQLLVESVPVASGTKFAAGFPITVVARAAEAWITTLEAAGPGSEDSGGSQARAASADSQAQSPSGTSKAAWKENSADWAVSPTALPSQSAQQPPSAPQSASATTLIRHGTWWDRVKPDPLDVVMEGRFTRLFPHLPAARFDQADLKQLACAMTAPEEPVPETEDDPEENRTIPASYTYLGQFVDHDLTFDPTSHLREALTKAQFRALADFRTPRFDLDNLYGRGPDDQPYMYEEDGIHMLLGEPMSGDPFDPGAVQLPRGPNDRALIGDPRDDENRIVAQLHAIFLRFHNKVAGLGGKNVTFQEVRQQVQWHYQWILVNDFLPTILEEQTYKSVFPDSYRCVPTIPRLRELDLELMPVEFSVAAYRFGHSMIRPRYRLNPEVERPIFSDDPDDDTADLGGFRRIPPDWAIDWQFFIDLGPAAESATGIPVSGSAERKPQLSYKIDTSLVHPLGNLPARIATDPSSLARRNLERGVTFQLPSGQNVAIALGMQPIADKDLVIGKAAIGSSKRPITKIASAFAGNAPLWAYILSEAQVTSWKNAGPGGANDATPIKLGPVGGRLVAEVFASLLRGDPTSYLYAEPRFVPIKDFTHGGRFGLADLINVALGQVP